MRYVLGVLKPLFHGLLDFLLPLHCFRCHRTVSSRRRSVPLCSEHLSNLRTVPRPACHTCSRPLGGTGDEIPPRPGEPPRERFSEPVPLCGSCRKRSLTLSRCVAGFVYGGTLRRLVRDWKFGGFKPWGRFLGTILAEEVGDRIHPDRWDFMTPVPLHPERRRTRGFNQSNQLAGALQRTLQIPRIRGVEKQRRTRPQSELSRRERLENVRGAFRPRMPDRLENRSILVVDDVFTTGTTINEVARTLRGSKAGRVGGLVLARALPGGSTS